MDETDIITRLTRIEEKLDGVLDRVEDHEKRLRRQEYSIWTGAGVMAAVGTILFKGSFH